MNGEYFSARESPETFQSGTSRFALADPLGTSRQSASSLRSPGTTSIARRGKNENSPTAASRRAVRCATEVVAAEVLLSKL